MTVEQLAEKIFLECEKDGEPVTKDEAIEMAEMELKSKQSRMYVKDTEKDQKKEKKVKTVKVTDEKKELFNLIFEGLDNFYGNCTNSGQYSSIELEINNKKFTIKVIEHRK